MAKRALVSVSDKKGLLPFVKGLQSLGWEIIATGGTQRLLEEGGIKTIGISDITGFPEICDGRVKTLHPKVHGALLARRDVPAHLEALRENNIEFIDLVCVNLYPFRETIAKADVTMAEAIEKIAIDETIIIVFFLLILFLFPFCFFCFFFFSFFFFFFSFSFFSFSFSFTA
mgnify:CR=1 FL=1